MLQEFLNQFEEELKNIYKRIAFNKLKNYAEEYGIAYDSFDDFLETEQVQRLFEQEISALINTKNGFKAFEQIINTD